MIVARQYRESRRSVCLPSALQDPRIRNWTDSIVTDHFDRPGHRRTGPSNQASDPALTFSYLSSGFPGGWPSGPGNNGIMNYRAFPGGQVPANVPSISRSIGPRILFRGVPSPTILAKRWSDAPHPDAKGTAAPSIRRSNVWAAAS